MDYIPGVDLWTYLKEHGPLSESQAVALARKLAHALRALHQLGIIHLDLKLSNVMLTPDGEVRLVDFGLAYHRSLPDLIYESFQEPKGTPAYIAPEQFSGVRDEPRSDIFSFGTMLFELTTGKLPYPETTSVLGVSRRIGKDALSPRYYQPELSEAFEGKDSGSRQQRDQRLVSSARRPYGTRDSFSRRFHDIPANPPQHWYFSNTKTLASIACASSRSTDNGCDRNIPKDFQKPGIYRDGVDFYIAYIVEPKDGSSV